MTAPYRPYLPSSDPVQHIVVLGGGGAGAPVPEVAKQEEPETMACDHCGQDRDLGEMIDNTCRSCYEEAHFTCQSCDETHHVDYAQYSCNDVGPFCPSCRSDYDEGDDEGDDEENDDEGGGCIKNHDYDVLNRLEFMGNPADRIYYGIELEVEVDSGLTEVAGYFSSALTGYAVLKADGSLSHGFEVVTAPATLDIHRKLMGARFLGPQHRDVIHEHNIASAKTDTCGMHVHVSRKPLSQLQIGKMQVFLHNPENAAFVACIAQRPCNRWADYTATKKLTDLRTDNRYTALNLQNANTVELRIFRGNLRLDRVMKNLEFTAALVRWCGTGVSGIGECSRYQNFVDWVRKADYPDLYAFLQEKGFKAAPKFRLVVQSETATSTEIQPEI